MPLSQELQQYLASAPFDKSVCQIVGPQIVQSPALFFMIAPASEAGSPPAREKIVSELIQQLARDAGTQTMFTEMVNGGGSDQKLDEEEAERQLLNGQISGVQHASMLLTAPLTLVRLDEKLNEQNYREILQQWQAGKEKTEKASAFIHSALKRTVSLANKTIQGVLIRGEAYRGGRMLLSEYVRNLVQEAQTVHLDLKTWPALRKFHDLAVKEQEIDVSQARQEIEQFGEKLLQALGEKEVWLRKTVEALSSVQPGEMKELEEQLAFLADYLNNSVTMRKLRESLFYRIALYGAYAEGFQELEKPREMASRGRREKAFFSGVLQGPTHILMLLTKKLLAANTQADVVVPETYDFILDVAMFTGFDEADMPHLIQYVQYGNRYRSLVTAQLLREIEALEQQVLERAAASEPDHAVVELHSTFGALRKRVLLQLEWGDTVRKYTQEPVEANVALQLKQLPLLQQVLKKEAFVVIDALSEAETLARQYYQRLERRGQIMGAQLRAELGNRNLDRAMVYVSEYTCKSLLANLPQLVPQSSHVVLIPFQGSDRRYDADFSKFQAVRQKQEEGIEDLAFYRNVDHDLAFLPRKHCDSPVCRFAGPAISDQSVCLIEPGSQAVFYCETCNKHYCGLELKPVYMSDRELEQWLSFNPMELLGPVSGKKPFALQCRHCGNLVGKGKKTAVWNVDK